tara:strand:- start:29 stop:838 length:810 start_codon:yes stop_codon:yes gene_type:complete
MLMYSGNHSLVNNEERYKILFHAKRAVQELNYDAFKEVKVLQLNVDDNLRFILPSDYVNWVRLSLYKNGVLRPLTENIQVNSSAAYSQNGDGKILFDGSGNIITKFSDLDTDRITGIAKSIYLNNLSSFNGAYGYNDGGDWYFDYNVGARFGLNTETANFNPTFVVDKKTGVINFSSDMAGESCVLEYISDGMENGDDSKVTVNKLFEDYLYAHIEYAILNSKLNVQEYVVRRAQKRKTALFRNAKIRISNIHPGRLLMNMRGQNKWLK